LQHWQDLPETGLTLRQRIEQLLCDIPSELVRVLRERLERQRAQLQGEPVLVSMVKCIDPSDDSFETVNVLLPAREL